MQSSAVCTKHKYILAPLIMLMLKEAPGLKKTPTNYELIVEMDSFWSDALCSNEGHDKTDIDFIHIFSRKGETPSSEHLHQVLNIRVFVI